MASTDAAARLAELKAAFVLVRDTYEKDIAEADKIDDYKTRQGRKNEIRSNYYAAKALFWHAQTAELTKVGVDIERAFAAAVAARAAIVNATAAEKNLVARIKRVSDLIGAATDLYAKAKKAA